MIADALDAVRERSLPVDAAFAGLIPELRRGWVVGCSGRAAMSLALGLVARPVTVGSWLAVVAAPMLSPEAADELGVPLTRLVRIDAAGATTWAERVVAAADGFELILTVAPVGAERHERRVRQRLRARGAVLVTVAAGRSRLGSDVELATESVRWEGVAAGAGHLRARRVEIIATGRRLPRPAAAELWLPGADGRVAPVRQHIDQHADQHADRHADQHVDRSAGGDSAIWERVG